MTTIQYPRETGRQVAPGIRSRRYGQTTILTVKAVSDRAYQNTMYRVLGEVGLHVALELVETEKVNSGFVGLLAAAARTLAARGGHLYLLNPPPAVRRLLALSGIGSAILPVVDDEAALP